jgi:capsular polysaccharide export protein
MGKRLPAYGDGQPFPSPFTTRAVHDVLYHLAGFSNPLFFPRYRTHAPVNAAVEYLGYIRRLPMLRLHRQRDDALIEDLIRTSTPFFVLPLQLGGDAQIRAHSRFNNMTGVLECVLESFARNAPRAAKLLIKNHPLDTGLDNYPKILGALANRLCLTGRIKYLETGDLERMLRHAQGTVTVNSTVGALALGLGCPTIALSNPIYNLPGLTFQGPLDSFWDEGAQPDAELFGCFRHTVIHATQVNGGFYSRQGIDLLVKTCRPLLEAEQSPLEALL